ncbi:MAG TPA: hypothetical protein VH597_05645 [Verrucomicrobiae bacterium]|jgi:hypothetical protein|nr:hypothetical protein [Verrucomicrobiae bacterium]
MNNSYVIQWKSKVNGRAGRGTKRFEKEEVEQLVEELNREYPQIDHQAIPAADAERESAEDTPTITGISNPMFSPA